MEGDDQSKESHGRKALNRHSLERKNAYNRFISRERARFEETHGRPMTRDEWTDMSKRWKSEVDEQRERLAGSKCSIKATMVEDGCWNISCRPRCFSKHVKGLSEEQKRLAYETGLGSLLKNQVWNLKTDLICWLVRSCDLGSMTLCVHGKKLHITAADVTAVMGVSDGSTKFDLKKKSTLVHKYCKYVSQHWVIDENGISEKLTGSSGVEFKRLYILLALATVLCPSNRKYLGSQFVNCIENEESFNDGEWGTLIFQQLVLGMKKVLQDGVKCLGGCALFLQVFYMNHVLLGGQMVDVSILPIAYFTDSKMKEICNGRVLNEVDEVCGNEGNVTLQHEELQSLKEEHRHKDVEGTHGVRNEYNSDSEESNSQSEDKRTSPVSSEQLDKLVAVVGALCTKVSDLASTVEDVKAEQEWQRRQLTEINEKVGILIEALKSKRVKDTPQPQKMRREDTHASNASYVPTMFCTPQPVTRAAEKNVPVESDGVDDVGGQCDFLNELGDDKPMNRSPVEKDDEPPKEEVISPSQGKGLQGKGNADVVNLHLLKTDVAVIDIFSESQQTVQGKSERMHVKRKGVDPIMEDRRQRIPLLSKLQTSPFIVYTKSKRGVKCHRFAAGPYGLRYPFSQRELQVLMYVFGASNNECEVLVHPGGPYQICRTEMLTLNPGQWVMNVIINVRAVILILRARAKSSSVRNWWLPIDFTFLAMRSRDDLLHWVKKHHVEELLFGDISNCDKIFLPIHEDGHFYLLVVDTTLMTISAWDTLGKGRSLESYMLSMELQCAALDVVIKPDNFSFTDFKKVKREPFPKQPNGFDCGMFVCYFMENPTKVTMRPHTAWDSDEERCRLLLDLILCEENQLSTVVEERAKVWFEAEQEQVPNIDIKKDLILSMDDVGMDTKITATPKKCAKRNRQ